MGDGARGGGGGGAGPRGLKISSKYILDDPLSLNFFSISDVQTIKIAIEDEMQSEMIKFSQYKIDVDNFAATWEEYRKLFISHYMLETMRTKELEKQLVEEMQNVQIQYSNIKQYISSFTSISKTGFCKSELYP